MMKSFLRTYWGYSHAILLHPKITNGLRLYGMFALLVRLSMKVDSRLAKRFVVMYIRQFWSEMKCAHAIINAIASFCEAPNLFDPRFESMWPLGERFLIEIGQKVGIFEIAN